MDICSVEVNSFNPLVIEAGRQAMVPFLYQETTMFTVSILSSSRQVVRQGVDFIARSPVLGFNPLVIEAGRQAYRGI